MTSIDHKERAHSKFSASGADRWFHCAGSVEASEGVKDKSTEWSLEGTRAHELLERIMNFALEVKTHHIYQKTAMALAEKKTPPEMVSHGMNAANFILSLGKSLPGSNILVENRVYLHFIHPEMFGTYDGAVLDHWGTLHVFDYKYGKGHSVSPKENLQMIFYGIGLAHKYKWNFKKVRLWIIQPRIRGYNGPLFWDLHIDELLGYVEQFKWAVDRVIKNPDHFVEGEWCYWCKGKVNCPLKRDKKLKEAQLIFKYEGSANGKEKSKKEKVVFTGFNSPQENEEDY